MLKRIARTGMILRAIVHEFKSERITFMAGSIAFSAFLSLLPFLLLVLAVLSAVGDRELESTMIAMTESIVTPGAADAIVAELRHASVGASVVGLAVLVWGMLRIFRTLDMAFSEIYETRAKNTFTNQVTDGVVAFASVVAVIVAVVVIESAFSYTIGTWPEWFAQRAFLVLAIVAALVPFYYLFPDEAGMGVPEVLPGVFFTAITLVGLQSLFTVYVDYTSGADGNTMLASILLFLTWLYFSGLVVLTGGAINAVLSNRSEDVNIHPVIGGVPKADVSAFEVGGEASVPDETLHQLNHALTEAGEITVTVDGDEEFTMPAPDIATVDADTSPLPAINDTASIDIEWNQYGSLDAD